MVGVYADDDEIKRGCIFNKDMPENCCLVWEAGF